MAAEQDTEIEDELARGALLSSGLKSLCAQSKYSSEAIERSQGEDIVAIEEELCPRTRCTLPRQSDSAAHPECASVRPHETT